jgi:hypothetical protein
MTAVEHGFVIVRPGGRPVGNHLYADRIAAEFVRDNLSGDYAVRPARRVSSLRKASTTTLAMHTEIIIDQEPA